MNEQNTPQSIQLALNGVGIRLLNFQATVKFSRETQDTSGQNSTTATSDKGAKAKSLDVSGLIPYQHSDWLSDIFKMAEAIDGKSEPVVYRIANMTAQAVGMREGFFDGEITAEEQSTQGWQVAFTLKEKNSVSEKKVQRAPKPKAKKGSAKKGKKSSASTEESGVIINW